MPTSASPSSAVEHGRDAEALARCEEGLWIFEDDRPDERLLALVADLLAKAGRTAEAEPHLWRAFERAPSLQLYQALRSLAGEPARDRALAMLEDRAGPAAPQSLGAPADLLVRVLIAEGHFDRAWELARDGGVGHDLAETLARATEASHPREALAVYARRVDQLANVGGNANYAGAAELVARMAGLRDAAEQAAYVVEPEGPPPPPAELREAAGVSPCAAPPSTPRTATSSTASAASARRPTS